MTSLLNMVGKCIQMYANRKPKSHRAFRGLPRDNVGMAKGRLGVLALCACLGCGREERVVEERRQVIGRRPQAQVLVIEHRHAAAGERHQVAHHEVAMAGNERPAPELRGQPLEGAAQLGGERGIGNQMVRRQVPLPGLLQRLRQHARVVEDADEVRVTAPARHHVDVQVLVDTRARRPPLVEADVEPVRAVLGAERGHRGGVEEHRLRVRADDDPLLVLVVRLRRGLLVGGGGGRRGARARLGIGRRAGRARGVGHRGISARSARR